MKIVSMALMVLGIEVHGSGGVVGADDDDTDCEENNDNYKVWMKHETNNCSIHRCGFEGEKVPRILY